MKSNRFIGSALLLSTRRDEQNEVHFRILGYLRGYRVPLVNSCRDWRSNRCLRPLRTPCLRIPPWLLRILQLLRLSSRRVSSAQEMINHPSIKIRSGQIFWVLLSKVERSHRLWGTFWLLLKSFHYFLRAFGPAHKEQPGGRLESSQRAIRRRMRTSFFRR